MPQTCMASLWSQTERPKSLLLIGQGLAGSLLGWALLRRGYRPLLVDDCDPAGASVNAAGLLSPLFGKYFARSWRQEACLEQAFRTYPLLEERLGLRCFFPTSLHRVLGFADDLRLLRKKRDKPEYSRYFRGEPYYLPPESGVQQHTPGIDIVGGAWLDCRALVAAMRTWFRREGLLVEDTLRTEELCATKAGVVWRGQAFEAVVDCRGQRCGWGSGGSVVPVQPNQGTLLIIRAPSVHMRHILKERHYLLPLGDHRFALGATYRRRETSGQSSPEEIDQLMAFARRMLKPPLEIEQVLTGIRPTTPDHLPVAGAMPHPPWFVLTGFGSRGVLYAPYLAESLAEAIDKKEAMPFEVSPRRFASMENIGKRSGQ
jgi:glycine/D-amino acid oxidase-like deaminating enzyme